jgi:uncharacterized protein (TIGR02246 family)
MPSANSDHEAIRLLVKKINEAWVGGRPETLAEYFHPDMVIVAPRFQGVETGRDACVKSYADFVGQARVHEYLEGAPSIDVWNDTAVATYRYDITYEMDSTVFRESGWDLFVFSRDRGRWLAVWRTLIPAS